MVSLMKCKCLPANAVPHVTPFYAAYLEDFPRVSQFFRHPPSVAGIQAGAREVALRNDARRSLAEVLREQNRRFGSGAAVFQNIDRLASGAAAIVTGQQVGLFTGPSYTIYKALAALRVAEEITAGGLPAVPVFSLATEDHDLAEVDHCFWSAREGLRRLELPLPGAENRSVGGLHLGESVASLVQSAAQGLEGPDAPWVADLLRECYRPEETLGGAFAKLFARLFADRGLILLDPLDARLHRLAAPLFRSALEEHAALTGDLLARGEKLESAGFHSQVKVTQDSTLLFANVEGRRLPVHAKGDGFAVGSREFSLPQLLEWLEREPESFSPNVLLRPVMLDALLPTAAAVAGPAETAYLAQSAVVYERLREAIPRRIPAVLPRVAFTLVDAKSASLLEKYRLDVADVWKGRQHLRKKMEQESLPDSLVREFDAGEKALDALLRNLQQPLEKLDKTLLGTLEAAGNKMRYQYANLRAKAGRAQDFRAGILDTHERALNDALYPEHDLQERSLCLLPLLARHGRGLLAELEQHASLECPNHKLAFLDPPAPLVA
jgi:bacillithiol synthase